jgi:hypothetical protein
MGNLDSAVVKPIVNPFSMSAPAEPQEPSEPEAEPWVRPAHWLSLPELSQGDEKLAMLLFVSAHGTQLLRMGLKGKDIHIDWGDGSTDLLSGTYSSVTPVEHEYDYASLSGEVTSDGYKQVIITVWADPLSEEGYLSEVRFVSYATGTNKYYRVFSVVDMALASEQIGTIKISSGDDDNVGCTLLQRFVLVGDAPQLSDLSYAFHGNKHLRSLDLGGAHPVNMSYLCSGCENLSELQLPPDLSDVTSISYAFYQCKSLVSLPDLNLASLASSASNLCNDCWSLQHVGVITMPQNLDISNLFKNCYRLETIEAFDALRYMRLMGSAFYNCYMLDLSFLSEFSFPNATNTASLFSKCMHMPEDIGDVSLPLSTTVSSTFFGSNIRTVGNISAPLAGNLNYFFQECPNIVSIGDIYAPACTGLMYSFARTQALERIGSLTLHASDPIDCYQAIVNSGLREFDGSGIINPGRISYLFGYMNKLESLSHMDLSAAATTSYNLRNCYSLKKLRDITIGDFLSVESSALDRDELVYLFGMLPDRTSLSAGTVRIADTYGRPDLTAADKQIATDKNWTITE